MNAWTSVVFSGVFIINRKPATVPTPHTPANIG